MDVVHNALKACGDLMLLCGAFVYNMLRQTLCKAAGMSLALADPRLQHQHFTCVPLM